MLFDRIVESAGWLLWLAVFLLIGYLVGDASHWYWGVLAAVLGPALFVGWSLYLGSDA